MELKPCPFCGGEAKVSTLKWGDGYAATALCKNEPNLNTWDEDEAKAVERITAAWNNRHVETCRNVSDPPEGFLCSECGWGDFAEPSHLLTGSCYAGLAKGPRYCPNCGRKVVSE